MMLKKNKNVLFESLFFISLVVCLVIVTYGASMYIRDLYRSKSIPIQYVKISEVKPSYEYLKSITVEIRGFIDEHNSWLGTGTIVKVDEQYTYILTNAHVAGQDVEFKDIYVRNGEALVPVEVIKYHPYLDLAILRYNGKLEGKDVVKGFAIPKITEKIYLVGHHLGMMYIYGEGVIVGFDKLYTIIQMPVAPGNSGSGVINKDGKLIAVVFAGNLINYFQMDITQGLCVDGYSAYLFLKNNGVL